MEYLKYLNRHQRELYCHHVKVDPAKYNECMGWTYEMIGPTKRRWQHKIIFNDIGFEAYVLFMFRSESDAVFFKLRWC